MFASKNMLLSSGVPTQGSLTWATNYGDTTTIAGSTIVTATTSVNSNGFGYFSSVLPPNADIYFDVVLASGASDSPVSRNFLGVSNTVSQFNYDVPANYVAWYYSGAWFGNGTKYVDPPTYLNADTYRIAISKSNNILYMKSNSNSTVASAQLPSGSSLYLCVLPQSGFRTSGATISGGLWYTGSGGLY